MSRVTKLELEQSNIALGAENALLRSHISHLEGLVEQQKVKLDGEVNMIEYLEYTVRQQLKEIEQLKAQLVKATQARREDVDYLSKLHAAREEAIRTGKTVRVA